MRDDIAPQNSPTDIADVDSIAIVACKLVVAHFTFNFVKPQTSERI